MLCKLVCDLYELTNYTDGGKWQLGNKNQSLVPKLMTYTVLQGFSSKQHNSCLLYTSDAADE